MDGGAIVSSGHDEAEAAPRAPPDETLEEKVERLQLELKKAAEEAVEQKRVASEQTALAQAAQEECKETKNRAMLSDERAVFAETELTKCWEDIDILEAQLKESKSMENAAVAAVTGHSLAVPVSAADNASLLIKKNTPRSTLRNLGGSLKSFMKPGIKITKQQEFNARRDFKEKEVKNLQSTVEEMAAEVSDLRRKKEESDQREIEHLHNLNKAGKRERALEEELFQYFTKTIESRRHIKKVHRSFKFIFFTLVAKLLRGKAVLFKLLNTFGNVIAEHSLSETESFDVESYCRRDQPTLRDSTEVLEQKRKYKQDVTAKKKLSLTDLAAEVNKETLMVLSILNDKERQMEDWKATADVHVARTASLTNKCERAGKALADLQSLFKESEHAMFANDNQIIALQKEVATLKEKYVALEKKKESKGRFQEVEMQKQIQILTERLSVLQRRHTSLELNVESMEKRKDMLKRELERKTFNQEHNPWSRPNVKPIGGQEGGGVGCGGLNASRGFTSPFAGDGQEGSRSSTSKSRRRRKQQGDRGAANGEEAAVQHSFFEKGGVGAFESVALPSPPGSPGSRSGSTTRPQSSHVDTNPRRQLLEEQQQLKQQQPAYVPPKTAGPSQGRRGVGADPVPGGSVRSRTSAGHYSDGAGARATSDNNNSDLGTGEVGSNAGYKYDNAYVKETYEVATPRDVESESKKGLSKQMMQKKLQQLNPLDIATPRDSKSAGSTRRSSADGSGAESKERKKRLTDLSSAHPFATKGLPNPIILNDHTSPKHTVALGGGGAAAALMQRSPLPLGVISTQQRLLLGSQKDGSSSSISGSKGLMHELRTSRRRKIVTDNFEAEITDVLRSIEGENLRQEQYGLLAGLSPEQTRQELEKYDRQCDQENAKKREKEEKRMQTRNAGDLKGFLKTKAPEGATSRRTSVAPATASSSSSYTSSSSSASASSSAAAGFVAQNDAGAIVSESVKTVRGSNRVVKYIRDG